ncbi:MAG: DUF2628 domain-containing protein [Pseudomonadota bacterium]
MDPEVSTNQNDIFAAPESDLETSADLSLLGAFIGQNNANFYRERFDRFEQGGSPSGWHWPAFFVAPLWLPHRKMWALTLLCWVGLPIVIPIFLSILSGLSVAVAEIVEMFIWIGLWFGFPVIATHLYYRHALKKVELVRQQFSNREQQIQELQRIGGTGIGGLLIGGIFVFVTMLVVGAALFYGEIDITF